MIKFLIIIAIIIIFIFVYMYSYNYEHISEYDFNIAIIDSINLDYYSSLCNINSYLGKKADLVFINSYSLENFKNQLQFNNNYNDIFPKNNTIFDLNNDINGYISYNTLKNNKYSGVSTESGLYYMENSETIDNSYGTSSISSFDIKSINSKHFNNKIKIFNYSSTDNNDVDNYKDLLFFYNMLYNDYSNNLFIIGGTPKIKYELIELAFNKSMLNTISYLYTGKSNNFIIINNKLISKINTIKMELFSPYMYKSDNDVLLITIKGFKTKNIYDNILNSKTIWNKEYIIPDSFYTMTIDNYNLIKTSKPSEKVKNINTRLIKQHSKIKYNKELINKLHNDINNINNRINEIPIKKDKKS